MAAFRFVTGCAADDESAASLTRETATATPPLPRVSRTFARRHWRGFLDTDTAAALRDAAASGAALEAAAPIQGGEPGASRPSFLPFLFLLAAAAALS